MKGHGFDSYISCADWHSGSAFIHYTELLVSTPTPPRPPKRAKTTAPLAQLVEHRSYEPKVMGSSPIWSTVSLPEWSKGNGLGPFIFVCKGSNPLADKVRPTPFFQHF